MSKSPSSHSPITGPPDIDPGKPARLIPVSIAKPWGREIWYTGMEARGESQVLIDSGTIPLSAYLEHNTTLLTNETPVLLLKVLDPKPAEVLGDLYFEVHEEKQEVYIVTHVDPDAWPGGMGGMRFGMNQEKRREYDDDNDFRKAYLTTVQSYEKIRTQIDQQGIVLPPETESTARAAMNSFANIRNLRVGDVVQVPTWTPHSLLHGVRVVEFQTPTYERFIISFAQQVLTQDHWDSDHAIANMHLESPPRERFEKVAAGVERIVRFDDFNVWRVDLARSGPLSLPSHIPYAVCMCLTAPVQAGELQLENEQACFVPFAACARVNFSGVGKLLIAAPGL